jgi:hypothetical protein
MLFAAVSVPLRLCGYRNKLPRRHVKHGGYNQDFLTMFIVITSSEARLYEIV